MIIWSGLGFVVPIAIFCSLFAVEVSVEAFFDDASYYQTHGWPKLMGCCIAAAIIWVISLFIIKGRGKRTLVDPDTNEQFRVDTGGTFFFISIKWWPLITLILGIVLLFVVENPE